jgi:hypothetical protein
MSGVFTDNFTAWCLAMALELDVELPDPGPDYGELGDALLVWAGDEEIEALSARVLEVVWSPELAEAIGGSLRRLGDGARHWRRDVLLALDDLGRRGRASEIAQAVVQRLALEDVQADHDPLVCLCCIEERLEGQTPGERRAVVLSAAAVACRDAAVPEAEVREALRGSAVPSLSGCGDARFARRLGADGRRVAVRARMGRLARLGRESMPALSLELEAILAEPMPAWIRTALQIALFWPAGVHPGGHAVRTNEHKRHE